MNTKHTPTPWFIEKDEPDCIVFNAGDEVGDDDSQYIDANTPANAAFIVRSVTAHDDLVDALSELVRYVGAVCFADDAGVKAISNASRALRKARGEA